MNRLACLCGLVTCCAFAAFAERRPDVTITVDLSKRLGAPNRRILGHNIEAADSFRIFGMRHNYVPGQTGSGLYNPETRTCDSQAVALTRQIGATVIRYPGGCLTHNFDWKQTIGDPATRPTFTFGLNEYLRFCRDVDAEPLITVSTYASGPDAAAELVEYLNAPATDAHPWALKRKDDGYIDPWGVKLFEIGNEADHGTHKLEPFQRHTAREYATFFNACAKGMKAIDPTIMVGAHMATGKEPGAPWDRAVLPAVKDTADFIAIHTYYIGITHRDRQPGADPDTDRIMQACMAVGPQATRRIEAYRALITKLTGRPLPIAVTEYNAGFVQDRPLPYRFTLGAALFCGDYLRMMMESGQNILVANYWQYHHGYWGMLRRSRHEGQDIPRYRKTPAFDVYRLMTRHIGAELVATRVVCPVREFSGYGKAYPCLANAQQPAVLECKITKSRGAGNAVTWQIEGQALSATLEACVRAEYLGFGRLHVDQPGVYRLQFEARYTGSDLGAGVLGLGLCDDRGWEATHSACAAEGIVNEEWQAFTAAMQPLADCAGLTALLRVRPAPANPLAGTLEIRGLTFTRDAALPPYPVVTAGASLARGGNVLHVVVFNKDHERSLDTAIECPGGRFMRATFDQVSGANLAYTNLDGKTCRVREAIPIEMVSPAACRLSLPPRSLTAIAVSRDADDGP